MHGQDGVGCLGAIVLDSLQGQFGEECRRVSGSDLYRREVGSGHLSILAVAFRDKHGAYDSGSGCHIEQQRLLRKRGRQHWR